ncbi:DUF6785 family protein [Planctomycetota bacterium]
MLNSPPKDDGSPRRKALDPPPLQESLTRAEQALQSAEQSLKNTLKAAEGLDKKKDVMDTIKSVENGIDTAKRAGEEIRSMPSPGDARRAAYLAWAADQAALKTLRGPKCVINADIIRGFRKGKTSVPWKPWIIPILYWCGVVFCFNMTIILGLMIFRRSWIEKERLPFPYARMAEGIIVPLTDQSPDSPKQVSFPRTVFYIAFLVGFLFCIRGMVSISETGSAPMPPGKPFLNLDLTWLNIIPGATIVLLLIPFALLFILFFPLDILFTVAVFFLLGNFLIPWIGRMFGVTDMPSIPYHILRMGGILGVSFFLLIFHFSDIKKIITGLWDKGKGDEANEPVSPRELSIGFLIMLGLFTVFIIWGEQGTGSSLFSRILMFIYMFAMIYMYNMHHIRLRASGAFQYFDFNNILHTGSWFNWHWWGQVHSVPMAQGSNILYPDSALNYQTLYHLETFGAYAKSMGPASQILDAFSLADSTNSRNRDIFKAVVIGMVVALILVMPFFLTAMYHKGYDNTPYGGSWSNIFGSTDKAYRYHVKYYPGMFKKVSLWWIVLGAAIYGVCMYLRREYARFPIEPMGLMLVGADGGRSRLGTDYIWFTFIVALFIKWIIFRWYGVRTFQEKVVPFLIYCLMGMTLGIVLYMFLTIVLVSKGMAF